MVFSAEKKVFVLLTLALFISVVAGCESGMLSPSQELEQCGQLDDSLLKDTCYFEFSNTVQDKAVAEFSWFGGMTGHPEDYSRLACQSIENPYLAYSCFRIFMRPHMKEFTTLTGVRIGVRVPSLVEECNAYQEYDRLFCTYLHAASLAKTDLAAAETVCDSFTDEQFAGECQYYVSTSLSMALEGDGEGNGDGRISIAEHMAFCDEISYPPWKSECFFVLADEMALLPHSDLADIVIACHESSEAQDYWCTHHVAYEMEPSRGRELCGEVEDYYKPHCYQALGETLTLHYFENVSSVVQGCTETPIALREFCFEGIGRRLSEEFDASLSWKIEYCEAAPDDFEEYCLNTLAEKVGYFAPDVLSALGDCALFSQEQETLCLDELSRRISEKLLYDILQSLEECNYFPTERVETCVRDISYAVGRRYYHDFSQGEEKCSQLPEDYRSECIQILAQTLGERMSADSVFGTERCEALATDLRESCMHGLMCGFEECEA